MAALSTLPGQTRLVSPKTPEEYDAMTERFLRTMGTATVMEEATARSEMERIYRVTGAVSDDDKFEVRHALYFCATVHGTSPDVSWNKVPFVTSLGTVAAADVFSDKLREVGVLRKFLAVYGDEAYQYLSSSALVKKLLQERAISIGLPAGSEHLVAEFLGRTGRLDPNEAANRVKGKAAALAKAHLQGATTTDRAARDVVATTTNLTGGQATSHTNVIDPFAV